MNQQPSTRIKEHPPKPEGHNGEARFDDRVKIVNETTGTVLQYQPFALHVFGSNKQTLRERPIGSGNMFDDKGNSIGRWECNPKTGEWTNVSPDHIATKPLPVERTVALEMENETLRAELEALKQKELASVQTKAAKKA